jgi:hypothetical protein
MLAAKTLDMICIGTIAFSSKALVKQTSPRLNMFENTVAFFSLI